VSYVSFNDPLIGDRYQSHDEILKTLLISGQGCLSQKRNRQSITTQKPADRL